MVSRWVDGQGLLFDPRAGMVRGDHPDTSRMAALAVLPRSGTQRRRVFDTIAGHPDGITDIAIQRCLGMDGNTERPRRVELVEAGLVRDSGRRALVDGRHMILWEVAR